MPDLVQLLRSQDLGYLQIAAELWGLEHKPEDMDSGAEAAAAAMLDTQLAAEMIDSLDTQGKTALGALAKAHGRLPWEAFTRKFGEVREMGAGRRDRDQPHLRPASTAEVLFYRALLGRAFFETERGPQEFAYIPEDLLPFVPSHASNGTATAAIGRAATTAEHKHATPADDRVLDEATTLLAALRMGEPTNADPVLRNLLECAGILKAGVPQAEHVKAFLETPRDAALRMLASAWRASEAFDELRLVPGLICEGPWLRPARSAREFILTQLRTVTRGTWWNLQSFVEAIRNERPDFQRPPGDYDSWFVKRQADGHYLRGFESWDEVDGEVIRFTIGVVMRRLALIEIGEPGVDAPVQSFRRTEAFQTIQENGKLHIASQGRISAPRAVPRSVRYQLARFCEWEQQGVDESRFRITPRALERAAKQGLKVEHLLSLLARQAEAGVPAPVVKALKRWEQAGTEARAETQVVLRVKRPEIIKELQHTRAGRFLDQALGPTAITIKRGAQDKVMAALAELGILGEDATAAPVETTEARSAEAAGKNKAGAKLTSRK